jgi:hypothetical protein
VIAFAPLREINHSLRESKRNAMLDITLSPEEIAALEAPYVPHIKTGAF